MRHTDRKGDRSNDVSAVFRIPFVLCAAAAAAATARPSRHRATVGRHHRRLLRVSKNGLLKKKKMEK